MVRFAYLTVVFGIASLDSATGMNPKATDVCYRHAASIVLYTRKHKAPCSGPWDWNCICYRFSVDDPRGKQTKALAAQAWITDVQDAALTIPACVRDDIAAELANYVCWKCRKEPKHKKAGVPSYCSAKA